MTELSGVEPEVVEARKVNPVARRLALTVAAGADFGFKSEVTLSEGLAELVAWWRSIRRDTPVS